MALHHSLRELVAARGPRVLDDPAELRGALDDFVGETEASVGEVSLLVDAVRLGALRRVLDVVAAGGAAEAAIREAGVAMAHDRGTDDPSGSRWALAALGYAVGRVDEPLVLLLRSESGTLDVPRPTGAAAAAGHTVTLSGAGTPAARPGGDRPVPAGAPTRDSAPPGGPGGGPPPQPAPPPPAGGPGGRAGRAGVVVLVGLVALVVVGLVVTGAALLLSGSGDDPAADEGAAEAGDQAGDQADDQAGEGDGQDDGVVPVGDLLVPVNDEGDSRIYRVDAVTGEYDAITAGPDDRLPAISPDRRLVTYLEGVPGRATVVWAMDPATRDRRPMFADDGPCAFASRPAWSPDGALVAVACNLQDGTRTGIYLATMADELPLETGLQPVVPGALSHGSPTWVSEETFVYASYEDEDETSSVLWSYTVGDAEPEQLTTSTDGYLTGPDWSERGARLLFLDLAVPDADFGTLKSADAEADDIVELGLTQVARPVWAPDGGSVAFTVLEEGEEVLATAAVDRIDDYTVLPDGPPGEVGAPTWDSR